MAIVNYRFTFHPLSTVPANQHASVIAAAEAGMEQLVPSEDRWPMEGVDTAAHDTGGDHIATMMNAVSASLTVISIVRNLQLPPSQWALYGHGGLREFTYCIDAEGKCRCLDSLVVVRNFTTLLLPSTGTYKAEVWVTACHEVPAERCNTNPPPAACPTEFPY